MKCSIDRADADIWLFGERERRETAVDFYEPDFDEPRQID